MSDPVAEIVFAIKKWTKTPDGGFIVQIELDGQQAISLIALDSLGMVALRAPVYKLEAGE